MGRTPTDSDPFLCVRNTSVTAGRAVTHYDPFLCVQDASVTTGRAEIHYDPFLCVYSTRVLPQDGLKFTVSHFSVCIEHECYNGGEL